MRQGFGYSIILFSLLAYILFFNQALVEFTKTENTFEQIKVTLDPQTIHLPRTSYMVDQNGKPFEEIIGPENRQYLQLKDIPKAVGQAFLATEDRHFYDHQGFDLTAIFRSLLIDLQHKDMEQGGSTITQQLARNLYLSQEKTVDRKLKELIYSYQLEKKLTKDQILELYINTVYFQHGIYGIEAASHYYFSRPVQDLNLAEIAFLCAIPNNPSFYDPLVHADHTKQREKWILAKMLEYKSITDKEYTAALHTNIQLDIRTQVHLYPDYASYVDQEFSDLVAQQEGYQARLAKASEQDRQTIEEELAKRVQTLKESGMIIHTALNPRLQKLSQQSLLNHLSSTKVEGALSLIDHRNQHIVALVGGKSTSRYGFNRAFQSYRQPGSAIKPLLVYGPYLDKHPIPITTRIHAENFCKNGYCPENYGGRQYGLVTLEKALAYSLNTAAIRLFHEMGVETGFSYLNHFGFQRVMPQDHSLPAALGGFTYGMTPLELTKAYTTFAHQGNYLPAHAITKVTDTQGNVLYQWKPSKIPVWKKETNDKMRTLLSDVVREGTATAARFPTAYIGGKTGTTNDAKDLWFVGLTENYTAGVWIGYDQPQNLSNMEALHPQILIWKDVMQAAETQ